MNYRMLLDKYMYKVLQLKCVRCNKITSYKHFFYHILPSFLFTSYFYPDTVLPLLSLLNLVSYNLGGSLREVESCREVDK